MAEVLDWLDYDVAVYAIIAWAAVIVALGNWAGEKGAGDDGYLLEVREKNPED